MAITGTDPGPAQIPNRPTSRSVSLRVGIPSSYLAIDDLKTFSQISTSGFFAT